MRWLKYTIIGLTSLILVSVAIIVILAVFLDQDEFREALVHVVNRSTDHHLEIKGPMDIDFSLSPSVKVSDIYFKTATEDFELSAAEIHIQVDILSLRSRYVIVREFFIKDSIVNIRQLQDDGEDEDVSFEPLQIRAPVTEKLSVDNLAINYWQLGETEPLHINLDSLQKDDKADKGLIALTGAGTIDGTAFKLEGKSGAVAALLTSDQPFPVDFHLYVMKTAIHAKGTVTNPHSAGNLDIAVQTEAPDVQGILELLHVKVPDIGKLSAKYRLAGPINAPQMNDIDISVSKDKVKLQVTGSVGNILTAEDTLLDFSAAISDEKLLAWLLPDESPVFHNIQSSGTLSVTPGALILSDFTVDASDPGGHRLEIKGNTRIVDAPLPLRDLNATVAISSPDTGFVRQFTEAVPQIGPVTVTARVSTATDALVVEDIKLAAGSEKTVRVEAQGDIRHIVWDPAVDVSNMGLKVNLTGTSARVIGDLINIGLPDVGPVTVKGQYSGSIASSSVKDLHFQAGRPKQLQAEARGFIKLAALDGNKPLAGLELDINFEAPSTASLTVITGTEIPALGRLKGSATIRDTSGVPGITAMDVNVQKGNDLRLSLNGVLADLEKMNGLDMKIDLFAADMNVIGQVFDQSLPKEGSVKLSGRVKGGLEQTRFTGRVNLRNTTIETDLTGAFTGERPRLAGSITIPDLDVHDMGHYPERQLEKVNAATNNDFEWHADEKKKVTRTTPLFSRKPLDLSGLKAIDLNLELTIHKLSSTGALLDNVYSHVMLDNGRLDIKPLTISIDGDKININGTIDSSIKPPSVSMNYAEDEVDLGLLFRDSATKTAIIRGIANAKADLHSRGNSPAELAAGMDGYIYSVTENARMKKNLLNLLHVDVLGFVISNILSPEMDINIDCAIISMHFDKGMGVTDLFIIDSPDFLVRVDANINLVNETMDVAILPERKVRLFKKNKPIKIYGPITNPTYEVVSLVDLTREATRSTLLAPLTISTGLLENITGLIVKPDEIKKGSCDKYLQ